jgi:hypothetical protein
MNTTVTGNRSPLATPDASGVEDTVHQIHGVSLFG